MSSSVPSGLISSNTSTLRVIGDWKCQTVKMIASNRQNTDNMMYVCDSLIFFLELAVDSRYEIHVFENMAPKHSEKPSDSVHARACVVSSN